jgi:hypothetical protein
MTKWEYMGLNVLNTEAIAQLNSYGLQGWEVVASSMTPFGQHQFYLLKRPVQTVIL